MPTYTSNFALLELGPSDAWNTNGYQFSTTNLIVVDALLALGAVYHHHDGASSSGDNPTSAPALAQASTGGSFGAATTLYYEYTYANALGLETAPSPVASVVTPAAVATPSAPTLTPTVGTGSAVPGLYQYALTAYVGVSTVETMVGPTASSQLTSTGEVTQTMPAVPSGADGFNVYRLGPAETQFLFLTTLPAIVTTFVDDGTTSPNCNRSVPTTNTTNAQNQFTVTITAPPTGFTANIYRSGTLGSWASSQVATGVTGTTFVDLGLSPAAVTPPTVSRIPADPSQILLTDGAEVQGLLPGNMVDFSTANGFPFAVTFSFPGPLSPTTGMSTWVCPFSAAVIQSVTCSLGVDSSPAAQPVIADVLQGSGTMPSYTSLFAGATPVLPQVAVNKQVGGPQVPTSTTVARGDTFYSSLLQAGGGATPTDHDLTVTMYLWVTP